MKIFNNILKLCGFISGLLILLTVILVCGEIGHKLIFHRSLPWVTEIVEYSLLWLTFLGTAWVLKEDRHIKMDMLLDRLNTKRKILLQTMTSIFGGLMCLIMVYFTARITYQNFLSGYRLLTYMELPAALINLVIPLGFLMLSVQFCIKSLNLISQLKCTNERSEQNY